MKFIVFLEGNLKWRFKKKLASKFTMLKVVSKLRTYCSLVYQLTDSIKGILALFFLLLLSIQAFAQNPVIEGTRTHVNNSETSNHTISLPSDIQVGDLILVAFRIRSSRNIDSATSGWTRLVYEDNSGRTVVYWKSATSSSESFSIGLSGSSRIAAVSYRISNWDTAETPQVAVTTEGTNPPNLNPGWGPFPSLYLGGLTFRESDQAITGIPSGFSNLVQAANTSSGNNRYFEVGIVQKFSSASSEDPSSFSTGGANPTSFTIAIKGKEVVKKLTVTSNAISKVYGANDPALTYTVTGFQGTDNASIITGALSRAAGEDAGTYAISQGTLAAADYEIEYVGANFSITPKTLTITPDSGQSKLAGEVDPLLTYQVSGFVAPDDSSLLAGALSRDPGEDVGLYEITLGGLSETSGNYSLGLIPNITFEIQVLATQYLVTVSNETPLPGAAVTIQAQLTDSNGIAVAESGRSVDWGELGGAATGSFATSSSITDVSGIAVVQFIASSTVGVSTQITASGSGGLFGISPEIITVDAIPTQLVIVQAPSGTTVAGQPFATQPVVEVRDANGNRVQSASTLISLILSQGEGELRGTIELQATNGRATFSGLNIDLVGDDKVILAEADGLVSDFTAIFSISAEEATTLLIYEGDLQVGQVGQAVDVAPTVIIQDVFGNPIAGVSVSFAVTGGGGSISPSGTIQTNTAGIAAVNSWTLGTSAGQNTLVASAAGLPSKTFTALATEDAKQIFTSNGTFTVPAGVTSIVVEAWGAGGAGGGVNGSRSDTRIGGGGGGGAYVKKELSVTPGEVLTLTVGVGGFTTSTNSNGPDGDPSFIDEYRNEVFAAGGNGGDRMSGSSDAAAGGNGGSGSASSGDQVIAGSAGTSGSSSSNAGQGGAGANGGAGGARRTSSGDGNNGANPGGGGSGGASFRNNNDRRGGAGGRGQISIIYPVAVDQFQATVSGNWENVETWEQRFSNGQWLRLNTRPNTNSKVLLSGENVRVQLNEDLNFSGLIKLENGGELAIASAIELSDAALITVGNGGTLSISSSGAITGEGDFILTGGGTLKIASPEGIVASGPSGALRNTGTRSLSQSARYVYNGSGDQVLGDGLPDVISELIVEGGGSLTMDHSLQVTLDLIMNSGTLVVAEPLVIDLGMTLNGVSQVVVPTGKIFQADLLSNLNTNDLSRIKLEPGARYTNLGISSPRLEVHQRLEGEKGWRMLGSPVTGASYLDFLANLESQGFEGSSNPTLQPNVLWWDETDGGTTTQGWRQPTNISQTVPTGRGHYVFVFDAAARAAGGNYSDELPITLTTTGNELNLNNGGFDFGVTFTSRATGLKGDETTGVYSQSVSVDEGFNLIANPTASFIDYFNANGWVKSNLDQTIYVWDQNFNAGQGNFINLTSESSQADRLLAPFQAFWVRTNAAAPVLQMDNGAKDFGSGLFYGRMVQEAAPSPVSKLNLTIAGEDLLANTTLRFSAEGIDDLDPWDAFQLESLSGDWLNLYTTGAIDKDVPLAINHMSLPEESEKIVPLFLSAAKNGKPITGDFTLNWELPETWPTDYQVVLMDHISQQAIDMREVQSYDFTFEAPTALNARLRNEEGEMKMPQAVVFAHPKTEETNPTLRTQAQKVTRPFSIVLGYQGEGASLEYRPETPKLYAPSPNPFMDMTKIKFYLPLEEAVVVKIYDMKGQEVGSFDQAIYPAGTHSLDWRPTAINLSRGVYLIVVQTNTTVLTQKALKL
jgi:hypothetical protein